MNKHAILFLTNLNSRETSEFETGVKKSLLTPEMKKEGTCLSFIHEIKVPEETDQLVKKKKPSVVVFSGVATDLVRSTVARIKKRMNGHTPGFLTIGIQVNVPGVKVDMIKSLEEVAEKLPVCS